MTWALAVGIVIGVLAGYGWGRAVGVEQERAKRLESLHSARRAWSRALPPRRTTP